MVPSLPAEVLLSKCGFPPGINCLSQWVTQGSVLCKGILQNSGTGAHVWSGGSHLQSPGLDHRRSAAEGIKFRYLTLIFNH